jgi:hypothetical protein
VNLANPSVRMLRSVRMIRDTLPITVRMLRVSYVNPNVRMLRAVRTIVETHILTVKSVECELCKP